MQADVSSINSFAFFSDSKTNSRNKGKNLTPKQKKEIQECFELFDDNGKGSMFPKEFYIALICLGFTYSEEVSAKLFKQMDKNNNGKVELTEFTDMMTQHISERDERERIQLKKLMASLEQEERVTPLDKLRNLAQKMGEDLSDEELKNILEHGEGNVGAGPNFNNNVFFEALYDITQPAAVRERLR
mmetsp:Transcript_17038/g.23522  ORF Transcript_17038/g.23522 Transcript_17038/m.23522 type:complete len:187 (-) Transcript_17038:160-720(-)